MKRESNERKKDIGKAKQHRLALIFLFMSKLSRQFQGKHLTAEFHIKANF